MVWCRAARVPDEAQAHRGRIGPAALIFATGNLMPAEIAQLTAADFEPRIKDNFCIPTPVGEVELKLVAVRQLGKAIRQGGAFSLTFLSPPGPFLPQATYALQHAALGAIELFLVPLGPGDGGNTYEAVFT
jgi:hypothetical protein